MIQAARKTVTVTYATAQEYLDGHAVRSMRGGNEFDVWAAPDLVVKNLSHDRLTRSEWMRLGAEAGSAGRRPPSLAEYRRSDPMVQAIFEKKRAWQDGLKARLGRYVVPFEIVPQLRIHERRMWGLFGEYWTEPTTLYHAYVQRRVRPDQRLDREIARRRSAGDAEGMRALLDAVMGTFAGIARAGYLVHDFQLQNFAWYEGAVCLLDLGAVWKIGGDVEAVLTAGTARSAMSADDKAQYLERNLLLWERAIVDERQPVTSKEYVRFAGDIDHFFMWRNVHGLDVAGRKCRGRAQNGDVHRVPDVFPLTIEVERAPTPIMQRRLAGLFHGANDWDPARYLPTWMRPRN